MRSNPATDSMPITRSTFTTPFSYKRGIFAVIVSLAMGCSAALAQMTEQRALSAFYYGAREYNLITFGDYTVQGHDVWGGVAVGGNFTDTGAFTLVNESWCRPRTTNRSSVSDPSVLIVGKLDINSGINAKVNYGDLAYNPTNNSGATITTGTQPSLTTKTGGSVTLNTPASGFRDLSTTSSVIDFAALKANLGSAQQFLKAQGISTTTQKADIIDGKISATRLGVSYLDLNANQFSGTDLNFSVAEGSTLVINLHVSATAGNRFAPANVKIDGVDGTSGKETFTSANRILWNVVFDDLNYSTLVVAANNNLYGSFLTTDGTIEANTRIWGQVVANSYIQGDAELHQALFITNVPEPSTVALGLGAMALGYAAWRRRRAAKS